MVHGRTLNNPGKEKNAGVWKTSRKWGRVGKRQKKGLVTEQKKGKRFVDKGQGEELHWQWYNWMSCC